MSSPNCPAATLDPAFSPLGQFHRSQAQAARLSGNPDMLRLALERENGNISVFETAIGAPGDPATLLHAERLAKFMLWAVGGWRLFVSAPQEVTAHLAKTYAHGGARAFDVELMEKVYEKPFEVVPVAPEDLTCTTRSDNLQFFTADEPVPHHVITMGLGTIMESRTCLLLVFGKVKAEAVAASVEGPVMANVPGSLLQFHPRTKVLLDAEAASLLARVDYYQWVYQNKPSWKTDL